MLAPKFILVAQTEKKESARSAGDTASIPGLGRSSREGNPLQYACQENSMDREAW